MYREPATPETENAAPPPRELVWEAASRSQGTGYAVVWWRFSAPLLASVLCAMYVSGALAVIVLVVGLGLSFSRRKKTTALRCTIDRTDRKRVLVVERAGTEIARVPFGQLWNVALDVKTIRPVTEGDSMIVAVRLTDTKVGPDLDIARVVLETKKGAVQLTADHLAHMEATEGMGKIRVFLRKHGWLPRDERPGKPAKKDPGAADEKDEDAPAADA